MLVSVVSHQYRWRLQWLDREASSKQFNSKTSKANRHVMVMWHINNKRNNLLDASNTTSAYNKGQLLCSNEVYVVHMELCEVNRFSRDVLRQHYVSLLVFVYVYIKMCKETFVQRFHNQCFFNYSSPACVFLNSCVVNTLTSMMASD